MIYPEFINQPDVRKNYEVYTFEAMDLMWKLTVVRREGDPHSIISVLNDDRIGQWFSALDPRGFHGCLTPELAYEIIQLAFNQWRWGHVHGCRDAKLQIREALDL